jgi:hypothetical protein
MSKDPIMEEEDEEEVAITQRSVRKPDRNVPSKKPGASSNQRNTEASQNPNYFNDEDISQSKNDGQAPFLTTRQKNKIKKQRYNDKIDEEQDDSEDEIVPTQTKPRKKNGKPAAKGKLFNDNDVDSGFSQEEEDDDFATLDPN